jgi:hypothetical protein
MAERLAEHLRAVSAWLETRGPGSAPIRLQWLQPLPYAPRLPAPFLCRLEQALYDAAVDQIDGADADEQRRVALDLRARPAKRSSDEWEQQRRQAAGYAPRRRLSIHRSTRCGPLWARLVILNLVYREGPQFAPLLEECVLDPATGLTLLDAAAARRLDRFTDVLERCAGIGRQRPVWRRRAPGRWKEVVHALVMQLDVSNDGLAQAAAALGARVVTLDLLAPRIAPALPEPDRHERLRSILAATLERACARLGQPLSAATVAMRTPRGDEPTRYRVSLVCDAAGWRSVDDRLSIGPLTYLAVDGDADDFG